MKRDVVAWSAAFAFFVALIHCGRSELFVDGDLAGGNDDGGDDARSDGADLDAGLDGDGDALSPDAYPPVVPLGDAEVPNIPQITAGEAHACIRTKASEIFCWGDNADGQLGNGTNDNANMATRVGGLPDAVNVAAGMRHTCALGTDQSVWCWGNNLYGELGQGTRSEQIATPQLVADLPPPVTIASGGWHTCTLTQEGQMYCWGRNTQGECGVPTIEYITKPLLVPLDEEVTAMATGWEHTCAILRTGGVKCWGRNSDGQLGLGFAGQFESSPQRLVPPLDAKFLMAGDDHTCAILAEGTMKCWGDGFLGELGSGTGQSAPSPTAVANLRNAIHAAGGLEHTCAVVESGAAYCWGKDLEGQLGSGEPITLYSATPVHVVGIDDAVRTATGSRFSCIAHRERGAACWGGSGLGELGDRDAAPPVATAPVEVVGL